MEKYDIVERELLLDILKIQKEKLKHIQNGDPELHNECTERQVELIKQYKKLWQD